MEAVAFIDQADAQWVHEGQPVRILLDAYPDRPIRRRQTENGPLELTVAQLSRSETDSDRRSQWAKAGELPEPAETQKPAPHRPTYQARVLLDNPDGLLRPGLTGLARIRTENLTLAGRLWRLVCQTFRLE
jgi:hypothetical protein